MGTLQIRSSTNRVERAAAIFRLSPRFSRSHAFGGNACQDAPRPRCANACPNREHTSTATIAHLFFPLIAAFCLAMLALPPFQDAWARTTPQAASGPAASTWFVEMDRFSNAAHTAVKCEECHGTMTEEGKKHPDPEAPGYLQQDPKRTFDYQKCEKCHKKSYERYTKGAHAQALAKEKKDGKASETGPAPTCGDCHSAHYAPSHLSRVETGINATETCGSCHPSQMRSYLANYHGKAAVNLDYEKSAFCTDCHGAHDCRSLKEKENALAACRRCHFDAPPSFADVIIHDATAAADVQEKSETKQKALKVVHMLGWISLVFVVTLLVFFYSHSSLLLLRKIHEKLRKRK